MESNTASVKFNIPMEQNTKANGKKTSAKATVLFIYTTVRNTKANGRMIFGTVKALSTMPTAANISVNGAKENAKEKEFYIRRTETYMTDSGSTI